MITLPERMCEALLEAKELHGWSDEETAKKALRLQEDMIIHGEAVFNKERGEVVSPLDIRREEVENGDTEREGGVRRITQTVRHACDNNADCTTCRRSIRVFEQQQSDD